MNKLDANNKPLVDEWTKISVFKKYRNNVEFLEAYRYVNQSHVKEKLIQLTQVNGKWKGGHLEAALFDSSKPAYAIIDPTAQVYSVTIGGRTYKQVKKTSFTMKRLGEPDLRRPKDYHTWIEGITEQEYIEDIAYAFSQKTQLNEDITSIGTRRVHYISNFDDGTSVTFYVEDPFDFEELNNIFHNHLTSIIINPSGMTLILHFALKKKII